MHNHSENTTHNTYQNTPCKLWDYRIHPYASIQILHVIHVNKKKSRTALSQHATPYYTTLFSLPQSAFSTIRADFFQVLLVIFTLTSGVLPLHIRHPNGNRDIPVGCRTGNDTFRPRPDSPYSNSTHNLHHIHS